jgi:hypothetical protein
MTDLIGEMSDRISIDEDSLDDEILKSNQSFEAIGKSVEELKLEEAFAIMMKNAKEKSSSDEGVSEKPESQTIDPGDAEAHDGTPEDPDLTCRNTQTGRSGEEQNLADGEEKESMAETVATTQFPSAGQLDTGCALPNENFGIYGNAHDVESKIDPKDLGANSTNGQKYVLMTCEAVEALMNKHVKAALDAQKANWEVLVAGKTETAAISDQSTNKTDTTGSSNTNASGDTGTPTTASGRDRKSEPTDAKKKTTQVTTESRHDDEGSPNAIADNEGSNEGKGAGESTSNPNFNADNKGSNKGKGASLGKKTKSVSKPPADSNGKPAADTAGRTVRPATSKRTQESRQKTMVAAVGESFRTRGSNRTVPSKTTAKSNGKLT